MKIDIRPEVRAAAAEAVVIRRSLHQRPELGLATAGTADLIEKKLRSYGIPSRRIIKNGVVGLIRGGRPGKTVLIRADIDGLPVTEQNDVPYKSKTRGTMHA